MLFSLFQSDQLVFNPRSMLADLAIKISIIKVYIKVKTCFKRFFHSYSLRDIFRGTVAATPWTVYLYIFFFPWFASIF
jgi:hypothetical protein